MATFEIDGKITIRGIKSKKQAIEVLQEMLDAYDEMSIDENISVTLNYEEIKRAKLTDN